MNKIIKMKTRNEELEELIAKKELIFECELSRAVSNSDIWKLLMRLKVELQELSIEKHDLERKY